MLPQSDENYPKTDLSSCPGMEAFPEHTVSFPFVQQCNMDLFHSLTLFTRISNT
jgi:hypothetical protein